MPPNTRPQASRQTAAGGAPFTCTFCGLLCDDLGLDPATAALSGECSRAAAALAAARHEGPCKIAGRRSDAETAFQSAAELLGGCEAPLVAGLGADVAGVRAALALAERLGACVEHGLSPALLRNILPLQARGQFTTTLSELRNRADVIVFVGTDASAYPRFFERFVHVDKTLAAPQQRQLVFLGEGLHPPGRGKQSTHLSCRRRELTEVVGALGRLVRGEPIRGQRAGGIEASALAAVADALAAAEYGCIVWSAAELDPAGGDLTVEAIGDLVRALAKERRCVGLPLGGDAGAITAASVCTWQTGYPTRIGFAAGTADYQPIAFDGPALLASGRADGLLWINAYPEAMRPPPCQGPVVALVPPGSGLRPAPDVEIPIGVPGLHHTGHAFRCDSVVTLPLQAPVASALPSAAQALERLDALL